MTDYEGLDIEPEQEPDDESGTMTFRFEPLQVPQENMPLVSLLRFMPAVARKHALDAQADAALQIDVRTPDGLVQADLAANELKLAIVEIERDFKEPVSLANQLHKRLTGLRADFLERGKGAIEVLTRRMYLEEKRRVAVALALAQEQQRQADDAARKDAEALAARLEDDEDSPYELVTALRQQAEFATAPVVPVAPTPLQNFAPVVRWKARLVGTPDEADPNPTVADMSPAQQGQLKAVLGLIADGTLPVEYSAGLNWSVLNDLATAMPGAFVVPHLEAVDVGGLKHKRTRGR